jgi:putative transposon-encoded protein
MKIKITTKEKEFEGEVIERTVSPSGNSAHIPFARKHIGKNVNVIVPSDASYSWVLTREDLKLVVHRCKEIVKKDDSRTRHYKVNAIDNIQAKRFSMEDLIWVVTILGQDLRNAPLIKKINSTYSFEKGNI